jgi:hypothetical protein
MLLRHSVEYKLCPNSRGYILQDELRRQTPIWHRPGGPCFRHSLGDREALAEGNEVDRLRNEVIGADLKQWTKVLRPRVGRHEQHDRPIAIRQRADPAAKLQAIQPPQLNAREHNRERPLLGKSERRLAVCSLAYLVAAPCERSAQRAAMLRVIIDDEHVHAGRTTLGAVLATPE